MSNGRRIIVFSNANGAKTALEGSTHTTWGTLKTELAEQGFAVDSLDAVVRGDRTTLVMDDAKLPSGDFTLILVERKMKSGGMPPKQDQFTDLTNAKLKKACKKLGLSQEGDRSALLKRLRAKDKRSPFCVVELVGAKKKKEKSMPSKSVAEPEAQATTQQPTDSITADEAKQQVSKVIDDAKASIINILNNIKTDVNEGIDLFAGLAEEAKEIASNHKRG